MNKILGGDKMPNFKDVNNKIENSVMKAHKTIEKKVVQTYKDIESSTVNNYKNVEDKFIDSFFKKDNESTEEAKVRIKKATVDKKTTNRKDVIMGKREDGIKIFNEMMPDIKGTGEQTSERMAHELGALSLEYAFGTLWNRPGLDRKSRSLVTLGILIALRASRELEFHFPIALRNGLTKEELDEIIYHSTAYAGFPAASEASHVAQKVLIEKDKG